MRILRKGNSNAKRLAYSSLVRTILEYGAACWDHYREGQIREVERVQMKAGKFAHHTKSLTWGTLALRRKIARLCALYKANRGEKAWKAIGDRMERPHVLSRVDHNQKLVIGDKEQTMGNIHL